MGYRDCEPQGVLDDRIPNREHDLEARLDQLTFQGEHAGVIRTVF